MSKRINTKVVVGDEKLGGTIRYNDWGDRKWSFVAHHNKKVTASMGFDTLKDAKKGVSSWLRNRRK